MEKRLVPIIGRSSSGKSTLIKELSDRGYQTLAEMPRIILDLRKQQDQSLAESLTRQSLMYEVQKTFENYASGLVFLDRSMIDIYAFTDFLCGFVPSYFETKGAVIQKYHTVFDLESLKFESDGRVEQDAYCADKIHDFARSAYTKNGLSPIFVPSFNNLGLEESVKKRADFILEKLGELK